MENLKVGYGVVLWWVYARRAEHERNRSGLRRSRLKRGLTTITVLARCTSLCVRQKTNDWRSTVEHEQNASNADTLNGLFSVRV